MMQTPAQRQSERDPIAAASASGEAAGAKVAELELAGRVDRIINLMRPAVQADGGDLEFLGIDEQRIVSIRFHGACVGCPSSSMTLKQGIERNLRQHIPGIQGVVAVE